MKNKKSLQKLTEFKNLKELKGFLKTNPDKDDVIEMVVDLDNRMNKSYNEKLGQENEIMEMAVECYKYLGLDDEVEMVKNSTYETNHIKITSHIHNFLIENRCFPNVASIQSETGLSRTTIYNHLNSGIKSEHNVFLKGKIELMAFNALQKLYLIGITDNNASALKHFIELSGVQNNPLNVNNYIQINNLKLSKDEFNQLPEETIIEIETLISQTISKNKIDAKRS